MTIAARNRFIRMGALVSLSLVVAASASIAYMTMKGTLPSAQPGPRGLAFLDGLFLTPFSPVAVALSAGVFPLFSLLCLGYVLFAFEKTQTIEITFFAAAAFSVSLEALRILVPLAGSFPISVASPVAVSRAILFCRVFASLALLASVIFTTGQTAQQLGASVFLIGFVSFSLVSAVPFNSTRLFSNYLVRPGFSVTLTAFLTVIGLLAVVSYLIQGKTRASPDYTAAGVALLSFLSGYAILSYCDSWAFLGAGGFLLFAGGWKYLDRIHRYYLWQ